MADCYNCIQLVKAALGYVLEDFRRAVSVLRLLPVSITQPLRPQPAALLTTGRHDNVMIVVLKSHNSKEKRKAFYSITPSFICLREPSAQSPQRTLTIGSIALAYGMERVAGENAVEWKSAK